MQKKASEIFCYFLRFGTKRLWKTLFFTVDKYTTFTRLQQIQVYQEVPSRHTVILPTTLPNPNLKDGNLFFFLHES